MNEIVRIEIKRVFFDEFTSPCFGLSYFLLYSTEIDFHFHYFMYFFDYWLKLFVKNNLNCNQRGEQWKYEGK